MVVYRQFRCNLTTIINCRMRENLELLKHRHQSIEKSKKQLEDEINRKTSLNRTLISDMNSLRPDIRRLHKQREQGKKTLLEQGVREDEIDQILEEK